MIRRSVVRAVCVATLLGSALIGPVGGGTAGAAPTNDDTVYAFGAATFGGSTQGRAPATPPTAIATESGSRGYWIVTRAGRVYGFDAVNYGSLNAARPASAPIVGMAGTGTGGGYWLVGADGRVYEFGDAKFRGDLRGRSLAAPIIDIVARPGGGYWLVAADGGVFAFGGAGYHGSTGGRFLDGPIVGMAATPTGAGYWLAGADGAVFAFGDAPFRGSLAAVPVSVPIIGIARTRTGQGYWLASARGGVWGFGDAPALGGAARTLRVSRHITALAGVGSANGYRMLAVAGRPDVPQVAPNARGNAVRYAQARLMELGFWMPGRDGRFGAGTQQAVWAFQKAYGIPRSGWIDAATQSRFRSAARIRPRSTSGTLIEVDKARQILIVVRNGTAAWVANVSTGTEQPYVHEGETYLADTPLGQFGVIRQVDGPDEGPLGTLWRPKYFHPGGIAVHGSPSIPPWPASHGCVRVANAFMNWIWTYNVMPLGLPVWVY
ncbi:MAG: L,D-transpeptidase family protein [Actinomycetota bacterium]